MKRYNNRREILYLLILICGLELVALACFIGGLVFVRQNTCWLRAANALGALISCALLFVLIKDIALPIIKLHELLNLTLSESAAGADAKHISDYNSPLLKDVLLYTNRVNAQLEREKKLEALKKEAELNALRSQINPHFLYNTLDSIRGQLVLQGFYEAAENIEALSKMFRYSINPHTVYNTFEQELDNVRDYMRIMHFRLGNRLRFETILEGEREYLLSCEMPKLTLQPIVENAIQHGLEHVASGGLITLRAYAAQDGLNIIISDNGCGMDTQRLDKLNFNLRKGVTSDKTCGHGIALVNVNERIRMIFGGAPYGIHVYSDLGIGTQVHILIPHREVPAILPNESEYVGEHT